VRTSADTKLLDEMAVEGGERDEERSGMREGERGREDSARGWEESVHVRLGGRKER
jgi:hypothetical protein